MDGGALGIDRWAEHGIVGRGLLLDMPRYFASRGEAFDASRDTAWKPAALEAALAAQGAAPEEGDILLLRTGWLGHHLGLSAGQRATLPQDLGPGGLESPGLSAVKESAAFLWDAGFSLVAADNPAVEDSAGQPRGRLPPPAAHPAPRHGARRALEPSTPLPTTARGTASTSAWSSPSPSTCPGASARPRTHRHQVAGDAVESRPMRISVTYDVRNLRSGGCPTTRSTTTRSTTWRWWRTGASTLSGSSSTTSRSRPTALVRRLRRRARHAHQAHTRRYVHQDSCPSTTRCSSPRRWPS